MDKPKTSLFWKGLLSALVPVAVLLGMVPFLGPREAAIGLASLMIVFFVVGLFLFDGRRNRRSREIASEQGLLVERIRYDPTFFDPQHEFYIENGATIGYREQSLYSYSTKHRFPKSAVWALVMPEIGPKVEYPNGWKLVVKEGVVPDELRRAIDELANDPFWKKNPVWLEIDSYPDKICAVWDETNAKVAARLSGMLSRLSELSE